MRTYKIVRYQQSKNKKTGKPYLHFSLTIPTEIAEKLPEGMQFQIELTDEGILYRPIGQTNDVVDLLPAWATGESTNEDKPEPEEEEKPKAAPPKNNARKRPTRNKVAK